MGGHWMHDATKDKSDTSNKLYVLGPDTMAKALCCDLKWDDGWDLTPAPKSPVPGNGDSGDDDANEGMPHDSGDDGANEGMPYDSGDDGANEGMPYDSGDYGANEGMPYGYK